MDCSLTSEEIDGDLESILEEYMIEVTDVEDSAPTNTPPVHLQQEKDVSLLFHFGKNILTLNFSTDFSHFYYNTIR
jgi:hypothetical protein